MHFLVAEDDPIVADILGMTSEEAGYFKPLPTQLRRLCLYQNITKLMLCHRILIYPMEMAPDWRA